MPAVKRDQQPELLERPGGLVRFDLHTLTQALSSSTSIETIERMVALAKDVRAWEARLEWTEAVAKFQEQCPPIPKLREADLGQFSYKYSPLDQMLKLVRPVMAPLGLIARWRAVEDIDPRFVGSVCILSHKKGHWEDSGRVVVPIPEANRGANAAQRAGGAYTYSQRRSFCLVTGVVPEDEDSDGNDGQGQVGDYNHEGPPHETPDAERPTIIRGIMATIDQYKLTPEERLAIGRDYLPHGRLNDASLNELRELEAFLGDKEAVAQWRAARKVAGS